MSDLPPSECHPVSHAVLHALCTLGWQIVSPAESLRRRGGESHVLLHDSLIATLQRHRFEHRGLTHSLSPNAVEQVVRELDYAVSEGSSLQLNQKCYDSLALGISVTDYLPGNLPVRTRVSLINWQNLAANIFEVSHQVRLGTQQGTGSQEVDLLCFVNGLPLCVLACDTTLEQALAKLQQQQQFDCVPQLFVYAQLLFAIGGGEASFGTNQSVAAAFMPWHEEQWSSQQLARMLRTASHQTSAGSAGSEGSGGSGGSVGSWGSGGSVGSWGSGGSEAVVPLPEPVTQLLCGLLQPARLLDFLRSYVLFDQQHGKLVARSHQYFAVRALLERLSVVQYGERGGGVLWHTTGSGKSLTMVMLINALRHHPLLSGCPIVVVSDRIDLEHQLSKKFLQSGSLGRVFAKRGGLRARSVHDLARRIGSGSEEVLFTLLHKFNEALLLDQCHNPSDKMIVLIDEAHRSHGGQLHQRMRKVLKRAALVGCTGTPLLKHEKTVSQFGPLIHSYSMQRALQDKVIVPLLYEERVPELTLDHAALDQWYQHQLAQLPLADQARLCQMLCRKDTLYQADARIAMIARDIALHFASAIKPLAPGLKGMLATASKAEALCYEQHLRQTGLVSCAVIISPPDEADTELTERWRALVGKRADDYESRVFGQMARGGGPDLLIVVDRLLTGFDLARLAVLYIDKPLQQHSLLQAIARVNRPHPEKQYGVIIDYRGLLRPLDTALRAYSELEQAQAWDAADIKDICHAFSHHAQQLPRLRQRVESALWGATGQLPSGADALSEARRQLSPLPGNATGADLPHLALSARRRAFFAAWREFGVVLRLMQTARASGISTDELQQYQQRLDFFDQVAAMLRRDSELERPIALASTASTTSCATTPASAATIRYALPGVVQALGVQQERAVYRVEPVGMAGLQHGTDRDAVREAGEVPDKVAAETIRFEVTRHLSLAMDDDPWARQVLSARLESLLAAMQDSFVSPQQQYRQLLTLQQQCQMRLLDGWPEALQQQRIASAFYGLFFLELGQATVETVDPALRQRWVEQALHMAEWIRSATLEQSLNPGGLEEMIRNRLMRELFPLLVQPKYLDVAGIRQWVERVLQLVRIARRDRSWE